MIGVDPAGLTLRELLWMAQGRQCERWNHTAALLAMLANMFRGRGVRAASPADFHPLTPRPKTTVKELAEMGFLPKHR